MLPLQRQRGFSSSSVAYNATKHHLCTMKPQTITAQRVLSRVTYSFQIILNR